MEEQNLWHIINWRNPAILRKTSVQNGMHTVCRGRNCGQWTVPMRPEKYAGELSEFVDSFGGEVHGVGPSLGV